MFHIPLSHTEMTFLKAFFLTLSFFFYFKHFSNTKQFPTPRSQSGRIKAKKSTLRGIKSTSYFKEIDIIRRCYGNMARVVVSEALIFKTEMFSCLAV